jgi:glycosyltransferase involved in cell wall biosynthesis
VWEKNLKVLVDAQARLKHASRVQWVIVGDGPARAKLEELLPSAKFTGFLNGAELSRAYASSDLFVFPSTTETFGNVTVEALASGVPALCAASGGALDMVESGVNGVLLNSQSPDTIAQDLALAIDRCVENPLERLAMARAALDTGSRFSWANTARKYEELYTSISKPRSSESLKSMPSDSHLLKSSTRD